MDELSPKIEFKNVSKSFDHNSNAEKILEDISFDIYADEFVCILGPSGSGKSTVLGLIAGFIKATSGKISFNSKPIKRPDSSRTLVFQDYALFPWLNIIDNVGFGLTTKTKNKNEIRGKALEYLNLVGLSAYKDHSISQLSGGMKQRVAIARALCAEPEVLLLDEPFGALDQQTRENMQIEILRLWGKSKKTVVFVTHSVDEALKLADRIILIGGKPGKLLYNTNISISRPRDLKDSELNKIRSQIIDRLAQPEFSMGSGI
jgi:ABC-type nitrate/sulfonate/bicarbonate transport system ATPase subunit